MKVLKFGGTSVGTVKNLLNVKKIVESIDDQVIVVVSALGGITDKLIATSHTAAEGNDAYRQGMKEIVDRHVDMVSALLPNSKKKDILLSHLNRRFSELSFLYDLVYSQECLSEELSATIVSYGELLSSRIVSTLIDGARWYDSPSFIKTKKVHNKYILDAGLTEHLVQESFRSCPKVSLVPGFIAANKHTGETTNLGRGGSDYTAAIIASALNASCLEIWTDVDGFMTADPRVISSAHPIGELSYEEAIELCNSGAKVIYPPTIHPVCDKNIPIWIKNTMHPEAPGTIIKRGVHIVSNPIKGISSFKDISLISIPLPEETDITETQHCILQRLAGNGINLFMLSKPSCNHSISLGIHNEDIELVRELLRPLFANGGLLEHVSPMQVERDLATVTIVGENIHHTPYIASQLFAILQENGIHVIASTPEDSETNLSFVTECSSLCKALNVTHDSFFIPKTDCFSSAMSRVS